MPQIEWNRMRINDPGSVRYKSALFVRKVAVSCKNVPIFLATFIGQCVYQMKTLRTRVPKIPTVIREID